MEGKQVSITIDGDAFSVLAKENIALSARAIGPSMPTVTLIHKGGVLYDLCDTVTIIRTP